MRTVDKTGVEMEALTAAAVAGLTVYDMVKAVDTRRDPHRPLPRREVGRQVRALGAAARSPMTTAIIYSDEWRRFDYGPEHPLRMERLGLTWRLMEAYGLTALPRAKVLAPERAERRRDRPLPLARVRRDPARGERGRLGAARRALRARPRRQPDLPGAVGGRAARARAAPCSRRGWSPRGRPTRAFHFAGGLHHAMPDRASGFCYVNDAVLAIMRLRQRGLRVAYVDIDAHHGDGVQFAFYDDPNVLTDLHARARRSALPGHRLRGGDGRGRRARVLGQPPAPAVHRRRGVPRGLRGGGAAAGDARSSPTRSSSSSASIRTGPIRSPT